MPANRKAAARRMAEGAKAPSSTTIPPLGEGRLSVEQLNTLTRDVVDFLRGGPPEAPSTKGNKISNLPPSDRAPYKPRLESIYQALTEHLLDLQAFQAYLNPVPPDPGGAAVAGIPSSLDGLLEGIEALLSRNSDEFRKIRNLF